MADPGVRTKSKSWEEGLTTRIFKTSMATWLKMNNNKNLWKLFGVWYRERQRVNACNVTPAPEASVPCPWKVLLPLSGPLLTSQWSPSLLGSRHHVKHGTGPRFIFTAVSALNTCYLALRKSSVNNYLPLKWMAKSKARCELLYEGHEQAIQKEHTETPRHKASWCRSNNQTELNHMIRFMSLLSGIVYMCIFFFRRLKKINFFFACGG